MFIVHILKNDERARVSAATNAMIEAFKAAIEARHPLLKNVSCFSDGPKLRLQQAEDVVIQTKFYNGWTHDYFVSNILVVAPDGKITCCVQNDLGCLHDLVAAEY